MGKEIKEVPCLYCGERTSNRRFITNPKAKEEMPCCSSGCLAEVRKFIDWDSRNRMKLYLLLFVFVVLNLVFIGFDWDSRWRHLPLTCMTISVFFYPLVFTRYIRYQRLGIKKTLNVVKIVSILLSVFSILLIISY